MTLIFPLVFSFIVSVTLTPVTIILARRFGLVDDPKVHKHPAMLHKKIIPRAGGLPMYLAVLATSLLVLGPSQKLLGILLGGLILVVIGLIDDRADLKSSTKLIAQILAAVVVVMSGVGIAFVTNPLSAIVPQDFGWGGVIRLDWLRFDYYLFEPRSISVFADLFALFWIVWVINMVNFSTGVDGQMPGIVLITLLVIFGLSARFFATDTQQLVVAKLALIGAGATAGFLVFNFYPAKIFPGDSGSYFLGFLVAVVAILSGAKVGTAILVMAVPLIDGVFTIMRRIAVRKSPFLGDRSHLHHRLIELGWGQTRIALFYWLVCVILGAIALNLRADQKPFAGVAVAIVILGGLLWLNMSLPQKVQK